MGSLLPGWEEALEHGRHKANKELPEWLTDLREELQRSDARCHIAGIEERRITERPVLERASMPVYLSRSATCKVSSRQPKWKRENRATSALSPPPRTLSADEDDAWQVAARPSPTHPTERLPDELSAHISWWRKMASAILNDNIDKEVEDYRGGAYVPQYDVAGGFHYHIEDADGATAAVDGNKEPAFRPMSLP